jgi:ATP-grasp domain
LAWCKSRCPGPLVVFGLGGGATEALGDHVAKQTPLTDTHAAEMVYGLHAARLLFGHRGKPAVNTAALTNVLLRVSWLANDLPEIAELDLNPVIGPFLRKLRRQGTQAL